MGKKSEVKQWCICSVCVNAFLWVKLWHNLIRQQNNKQDVSTRLWGNFSHSSPCGNMQHSCPTETLSAHQRMLLLLTYRAPWSNTDSKLLPYEGVVDLMGNVMEGFPVIRANERGNKVFIGCLSSASGCAASVTLQCHIIYQTLTHLR